MKAWRAKSNQDQFRIDLFNTLSPQIGIAKAYEQAYKGRVGHALRDSKAKVLPVPSTPMQQLLLRAGLWPKDEPAAEPSFMSKLSTALRRVFS